jgi:hypothetical protein
VKKRLSEIRDAIKDRVDVFICSSSFEDRCFSLPNAVADLEITNKLIFYVKDLDNKIVHNADKLVSILGTDSRKYDLLISDPAQSLGNMSDALNSVCSEENPQCYMLDITTFTHEGLLMLFKLLELRLKENDTLVLSYNAAKEYSYNEPIPEKKWLSKGVNSIRSILGYPGLLDPSRRNHLVILFGFEREKTKRLIEMFEYDFVTLAFGGKNASISDAHQRLNEERHEELLRLYSDANKLEISLVDAITTKTQLLSYIERFSEYNTVIAPMNTKISSIGAALAAIENPEIQLCYVTANQYNIEGYTHPSDECYLFEIEF